MMEKVYNILKGKTYFIATDDNGQARVRPFGSLYLYEDKLYISTTRGKDVYDQIKANPKIELAAMVEGGWLRLAAEAIEEERYEVREMLWRDSAERLNRDPDHMEDVMAAFYLQNVTAAILDRGNRTQIYP